MPKGDTITISENRARQGQAVMSLRPRHRTLTGIPICIALGVFTAAIIVLGAQGQAFRHPLDHPAIAYNTAPLSDPVTVLKRRIQSGAVRLAFDKDKG